ncbi:MAG: methylmalonyl-CoA mutase family protein [Vicingaceae bacterium]
MSEKKSLFSDFETISDESWREKVMADLKGKGFEETLVWQDESGIKHQPYYRASDLEKSKILNDLQNSQKKNASWQLLQCFSIQQEKVKQKVQNALEFGVDQVILTEVDSLESILDVLGKKYKGKPSVKAKLSYLPTHHLLKQFYVDPIGHTIKSGIQLDQTNEHMAKLFQERLNQLEPDRFLLVDGGIYKMAGATIVQEMALSLQHAVEYFDRLTEAGYTAGAIARGLEFKMTYSPSFFPEIAKGRAMRYLIQKLFLAYGVEEEANTWGEGSEYYLSHQDPYTNLLRATTMSMAAVLGNSDKVSTPTFDQLAQEPSNLGIRMAKNVQLILKEEAYFAQVKDMAAGSYYIESLSAQLAEAAWDLFLEYESAGGLLALFKNGRLKKDLNKSNQDRRKAYEEGKVFLGVNQYLNAEGEVLETKSTNTKEGLQQRILAKEIETK